MNSTENFAYARQSSGHKSLQEKFRLFLIVFFYGFVVGGGILYHFFLSK